MEGGGQPRRRPARIERIAARNSIVLTVDSRLGQVSQGFDRSKTLAQGPCVSSSSPSEGQPMTWFPWRDRWWSTPHALNGGKSLSPCLRGGLGRAHSVRPLRFRPVLEPL